MDLSAIFPALAKMGILPPGVAGTTPGADSASAASSAPALAPTEPQVANTRPGEGGGPAGPSIPAVVRAASASAPSVPTPSSEPPPDVLGALGMSKPGSQDLSQNAIDARSASGDLKPDVSASDAASVIASGANTPRPALAPAPPHQKSVGERIGDFLPFVGAVGGAMEAAGSPHHQAPGAERLMAQQNSVRAAQMKARELEEVEKPKAQAYADYMSGRNETQENVAGTRAGATTGAAQIRANSAKEVATINANSKSQIAALQAGAPMTVTPQMAQIAGQPELAGQQLSGKSLANFMKMFTAAGAGIHDLGEEGLWAVDRMGNRLQRVAVSSPSVARAREFAAARAANTPVNILTWDENGVPSLKAISQAEQLRTGTPTAQVEQGILGPTSQTRTMGQMASTLPKHLDDLRAEVNDLAPYLGPGMGRLVVQGLAGKMGSTGDPILDKKMGNFISDLKLASSAVGRTHFAGRTGLPASQYFESLFNAARTPEEINGILQSIPSYIESYAANSAIAPQPRVGGKSQFGTPQQQKGGAEPTKTAPKTPTKPVGKKDSLGIL